jgi:hypothetical protein
VTRTRTPAAVLAAGLLAAVASGCATGAAPPTLPGGPWVPDPLGAAPFESATAACRGVRTLTAEISVRGRVGGQRLRGRVLAGFERGGSVRLEAPAPFGAPIFILTARANRGTLWLPRDRRILRDAPVADVLDAIVGLRRSSDDLLGLLSGCLTAGMPAAAIDVQRNGQGWLMVSLPDATTAFLMQEGSTWRLLAGHHDDPAGASSWSASYERFAGAFPELVRLSTARPGSDASPDALLSLDVSQRDTNTAIDARAFDALAAPDAATMTLDELRRTGPLADRAGTPGNGT